MVPKFPGSRTLSKAIFNPLGCGNLFSFILKTAKQSFGVVNDEIFLRSASVISVTNSFETLKFNCFVV